MIVYHDYHSIRLVRVCHSPSQKTGTVHTNPFAPPPINCFSCHAAVNPMILTKPKYNNSSITHLINHCKTLTHLTHTAHNNLTHLHNTILKQNPIMGLAPFREMIRSRIQFDRKSLVFALKGRGLRDGESVIGVIWKMGFGNEVVVRNGMVSFYGKGADLGSARKVFDESPVRDVVTWTALIDGYVKAEKWEEGLRVWDEMVGRGCEPNEVTMITVVSACGKMRDLGLGRKIVEYWGRRSVSCGLNLRNAMLDMYVKCGCLVTARDVFDRMEHRDVFSWTIMVDGYAKGGELDVARRLFDEAPGKNVICWNAMIAGYSQNKRPKEAIGLFHDMVEAGLVPNEATLVSVLSACAQSGSLNLGRWIHHYYVHQSRIKRSVLLSNALIDMYAKCGSVHVAESLFNEMPKRDLATWNSMIVGFADHGHTSKAVMLFETMKDSGIRPDGITFIGVLSACSHGGLVTKGRSYFLDMEKVFGLPSKVEHYACMIDLLGRVGLISEAHVLIGKMPMEPDEAAWGALLNGCKMHGNAEIGKLAAYKLFDKDPLDSGPYALLANLCARKKLWRDVVSVRSMMKERGIKKTTGYSSIEVEGELHEFAIADESHPRSKDVYKVLDQINFLSLLVDDVENHL
ncbi:hypothetical protein Droror1_Dr00025601 [Drosera rotundifolia]